MPWNAHRFKSIRSMLMSQYRACGQGNCIWVFYVNFIYSLGRDEYKIYILRFAVVVLSGCKIGSDAGKTPAILSLGLEFREKRI